MDFASDLFSRRSVGTEKMGSTAWDIGSAVLSGLLLEVSAYPKPGLVAPCAMGAHRDMDLQSFILSSAAIAPGLLACAQAGLVHDGAPEAILPTIHSIGRAFDVQLLEATHGVNTQRGILFCGGLLCAAVGAVAQRGEALFPDPIFEMAVRITRGLCARELGGCEPSGARTVGEILFRDHGVLGIRGEVESGFPTVARYGLPALRAALAEGHGLNRSLVHCLIALIAKAKDTTVLWRSGQDGLVFVHGEAARILALGGALTDDSLDEVARLNAVCIEKNISPWVPLICWRFPSVCICWNIGAFQKAR